MHIYTPSKTYCCRISKLDIIVIYDIQWMQRLFVSFDKDVQEKEILDLFWLNWRKNFFCKGILLFILYKIRVISFVPIHMILDKIYRCTCINHHRTSWEAFQNSILQHNISCQFHKIRCVHLVVVAESCSNFLSSKSIHDAKSSNHKLTFH